MLVKIVLVASVIRTMLLCMHNYCKEVWNLANMKSISDEKRTDYCQQPSLSSYQKHNKQDSKQNNTNVWLTITVTVTMELHQYFIRTHKCIFCTFINCDPEVDYPWNTGVVNQTGAGEGKGRTLHIRLAPGATSWSWDGTYTLAL